MTGRTVDEIRSDLSILKSSGVDRGFLAVNAVRSIMYETVEFAKDLKKFC